MLCITGTTQNYLVLTNTDTRCNGRFFFRKNTGCTLCSSSSDHFGCPSKILEFLDRSASTVQTATHPVLLLLCCAAQSEVVLNREPRIRRGHQRCVYHIGHTVWLDFCFTPCPTSSSVSIEGGRSAGMARRTTLGVVFHLSPQRVRHFACNSTK